MICTQSGRNPSRDSNIWTDGRLRHAGGHGWFPLPCSAPCGTESGSYRAARARSPAFRMASSGAGARPVICSTCRTAWCTSRSRPLTTAPPYADQRAASDGRPGVVEHVEQGRRALRDASGEAVGDTRRRGADHQRGVQRLLGVRPVGDAHRDLQPLGPLPHLGGPGLAAHVHGDLARTDPGQRGQCGRGGGARAQDRGGLDLVDAVLAQSRDHTGDVGVVAGPAAVRGEDDRVDRIDGGRGLADPVEQRDHGPLQRHGQREPRPFGSECLEEPGQRGLVDLEPLVRPAGQPQLLVCRAVQDRGERVGDRGAENGGSAGCGHQVFLSNSAISSSAISCSARR
ncbi:hypothetical protein SVIOM74S_07063 [Streptomyces violarus]